MKPEDVKLMEDRLERWRRLEGEESALLGLKAELEKFSGNFGQQRRITSVTGRDDKTDWVLTLNLESIRLVDHDFRELIGPKVEERLKYIREQKEAL